MNKKTLIIFIVMILLFVNSVHAALWAIIGMQGLQMANPAAAAAVQKALGAGFCVTNPAGCVIGYGKGQISQQAMQTLGSISPQAAQAVATFQQVQGYINLGAEIKQDLQINENGEATSGAISFKEKKGNVGNILSKDLKSDDIKLAKGDLQISTIKGPTGEVTRATVTLDEGGVLEIKGEEYKNVDKGAKFNLDKNGELQSAEFISKGGTYALGEQKVTVPSGAHVVYKNGEVEVAAKKDEVIQTAQKIETGFSKPADVKVLEDGKIKIRGNTISGEGFEVNKRLIVETGEVSLEKDGIVIGANTKSFARDSGIGIQTKRDAVMFYNEGAPPCEEGCYTNYIAPSGNNLKLVSNTPDGFSVELGEGNKYTGKNKISYSLASSSEVEISKTGPINIKTSGGIVTSSDGKQILEYRDGKIYSPIKDKEAKLFGSESNIESSYSGSDIMNSNGGTSVCSTPFESTGVTASVIYPFKITGMAEKTQKVCSIVVPSEQKVPVTFDYKSRSSLSFGKRVYIADYEVIPYGEKGSLLKKISEDKYELPTGEGQSYIFYTNGYVKYLTREGKELEITIYKEVGEIPYKLEREQIESLGMKFNLPSEKPLEVKEIPTLPKPIVYSCPFGYELSGNKCFNLIEPNKGTIPAESK